MGDATLDLQCTQLYSLQGFQSFCGIYIVPFTLPCHHAGLDLGWKATDHRPPVSLQVWCKSNRKVVFLVPVVKSQPSVSLFGLVPLTGPDFTHW